jgi:Acyclic terpene utilisation family protein AtuA
LKRCEHIVGVMGYEPIAAALRAGADVVLAGRATDTAILAAVPLMRGCPPGPSWHAAKTAECGGMCTTNPRAGGVLIGIDGDGFTVEPLSPEAACTPASVAAHMLYENVDPYRMREPGGTIDATDAVYTALDDRRVRVQGSRFQPAAQYTVKLEGSAIAGYQTITVVGIRDPEILESIGEWSKTLEAFLVDRIETILGLGRDDYCLELRYYGWNAVLGALDTDERTPREVGAVLLVTAPSQATATAIAMYANPYLLHMPLPGMTHLPSFAFMTSPAEIERGALYEFVLNHVVEVDRPDELFHIDTELIR